LKQVASAASTHCQKISQKVWNFFVREPSVKSEQRNLSTRYGQANCAIAINSTVVLSKKIKEKFSPAPGQAKHRTIWSRFSFAYFFDEV
jgi:dissimilatory sulfite reductase (desulfoviridin) alpha/beta subunit